MNIRRAGVLLAILAMGAAFLILDLQRFLSLDYLQQSQARLAAMRDSAPFTTSAAFFVLYVVLTALSMPGALILTVAAGALFGFWWGLLIASFASSIGGTLAFLAARYVLRGAVKDRVGPRFAELDAGVQREGGFYLFSIRLIPLFPFFLVNLAMGLTAMRTWTFYWVSQLGMLGGSAVYVNAGTQLAQLTSLQGILNPTLVGSFVLLGLFPLLAHKALEWVRSRQAQH